MLSALEILKSVEGRLQLGQCQVEIHVCSDFSENELMDTIVGDIFITDKKGLKNYSTIEFPLSKALKVKSEIEWEPNKFIYHAYNKITDAYNGWLEETWLQIRKTKDGASLRSILMWTDRSLQNDSYALTPDNVQSRCLGERR